MQLPNDEFIKTIEEVVGYKYLVITETDRFKNLEIKGKSEKRFFCRIKKILKLKLNSCNVMTALNLRAISFIRYSAGPKTN